ncbi:MAG: hypothetical protein Q8J97_04875, partial [Flavobacteriaceae bacterium]|nr:hypothetical protein [Flavobacteriaceae bacterium]
EALVFCNDSVTFELGPQDGPALIPSYRGKYLNDFTCNYVFKCPAGQYIALRGAYGGVQDVGQFRDAASGRSMLLTQHTDMRHMMDGNEVSFTFVSGPSVFGAPFYVRHECYISRCSSNSTEHTNITSPGLRQQRSVASVFFAEDCDFFFVCPDVDRDWLTFGSYSERELRGFTAYDPQNVIQIPMPKPNAIVKIVPFEMRYRHPDFHTMWSFTVVCFDSNDILGSACDVGGLDRRVNVSKLGNLQTKMTALNPSSYFANMTCSWDVSCASNMTLVLTGAVQIGVGDNVTFTLEPPTEAPQYKNLIFRCGAPGYPACPAWHGMSTVTRHNAMKVRFYSDAIDTASGMNFNHECIVGTCYATNSTARTTLVYTPQETAAGVVKQIQTTLAWETCMWALT